MGCKKSFTGNMRYVSRWEDFTSYGPYGKPSYPCKKRVKVLQQEFKEIGEHSVKLKWENVPVIEEGHNSE